MPVPIASTRAARPAAAASAVAVGPIVDPLIAVLGAAAVVAALAALSLAPGQARAAATPECSYRVEGAAAPAWRRLRVGEVDRARFGSRVRVVNDGPHDLRIGFDGLAPRLLSAGQAEPAQGHLPPHVEVTSIECLPSRAGPWRTVPGGSGAASPDAARAARLSPSPTPTLEEH